MKLLVSWMRELGGYVSREFYYIMQDLISVHGWRQMQPSAMPQCPGSVEECLLNEFGEIPDVVLFWEAYDLFKAIYQERGYRARNIPALILQKNLFGLEIDDRAAQLSAFALMMKVALAL